MQWVVTHLGLCTIEIALEPADPSAVHAVSRNGPRAMEKPQLGARHMGQGGQMSYCHVIRGCTDTLRA